MLGGVAGLEDALARGEVTDFNLSAEDSKFVIIEQFKEGNVAKLIGIAGHRVSRLGAERSGCGGLVVRR